jgi:hypothetical protein
LSAQLSKQLNPVQSTGNHPGVTARALLVLLRVYQTYLSSMNISACKFYPSCSHYAGEAVERFGARRGIWLTLKRLSRCQPFTRGGFDPVPDFAPHSHNSHSDKNVRATRGQEFAQ